MQELVGVMQSLGERARRLGILSLEGCIRGGRWTLLTEGIRLTVDGAEPALAVDMLEIRAGTILRNRTIRGHMAIEGCMAIHSGDNPAIVAQKLTTCFMEEPEFAGSVSRQQSVDGLIAVLRETPVSRTSLAEFVGFLRDLAVLARQKSLTALASLVVHVDDPVLAAGLAEAAKPDVLVAEAKRWAEEQAAALAPALTPSPTTPL